MYLKLTYFPYHKLILFSEKKLEKVSTNIGFKFEKYLNYLEILELESDWFYDILELYLKSTQTTLLDLYWFYVILNLKYTWTNLLDSDLIWL